MKPRKGLLRLPCVWNSTKRKSSTWLLVVWMAASAVGCSRTHYRHRADHETYEILEEKTLDTPWWLPFGFTLQPDPRSRLFDPSDPDDPQLPLGISPLYAYSIPELDSDREQAEDDLDATAERSSAMPEETGTPAESDIPFASAIEQSSFAALQPAGDREDGEVRTAVFAPGEAAGGPTFGAPREEGNETLPIVPIPSVYWNPIPSPCLARMFEFETVRGEYERSFGSAPGAALRDDSRKLTLANLVELARLNSREYQAQRENLYQAALALTLERFDYDLRFSPFGNGVDVGYTHARAGGNTVNTLAVPSRLQVEKMLATGGNFLARFANDVVLTFNGPNGFAADISSELLFAVTQTVFQRDVLLNPLIQAERDVVYAARDFARFRKTFFFQLASQYYNLILTYRQIEIESQNYFSLVRNLNQRQAEARAGIAGAQSPIQIDQIEQQVLAGRSSLISTCNRLEQGLDQLKITLGIPTETPVNLNLSELEALTLSDEIDVSGELVRRALRRLETIRSGPAAAPEEGERGMVESLENQSEALNASIVLIQRLEDWLQLREQRGQGDSDLKSLQKQGALFLVAEARLEVDRNQLALDAARNAEPPSPPIQLVQRVLDSVDSLVEMIDRQVRLAAFLDVDPGASEPVAEANRRLRERGETLRERFLAELLQDELDPIVGLLREAQALLVEVESLAESTDRMTGASQDLPGGEAGGADMMESVDALLRQAAAMLEVTHEGLLPVEISVDEAMATALVQRLDLMNQRGFLADDWRSVKYAADELKSILNLSAQQTIRTRRNRPFGFTFDESRTDLDLSLDLPLNRKAQRNSFRRALINFQASLRALTRQEDDIKFDVRNDLRDLDLRRVQYEISVASAALAFVRVLSTELELALGIENVGARDFLEAQDAYRQALVGVASDHIDYIVTRAQLFLDLELMVLGNDDFWPEIRNEALQPAFNQQYPPDAGPLYGEIPRFLKISCEIERMLCVPYPSGPLRRDGEELPLLDSEVPPPQLILEPEEMMVPIEVVP